jgi:U6 snRNA phosphodiesterase
MSTLHRKLPRLSPSLVVPTPIDNPALHEGRVRTMPHVEGQFAAYVYVCLRLERWSRMQAIVSDALSFAMATSPTIRPIVENLSAHGTDNQSAEGELHISLSRPTYLRAHQRGDLKMAVKASSRKSHPCVFSAVT